MRALLSAEPQRDGSGVLIFKYRKGVLYISSTKCIVCIPSANVLGLTANSSWINTA